MGGKWKQRGKVGEGVLEWGGLGRRPQSPNLGPMGGGRVFTEGGGRLGFHRSLSKVGQGVLGFLPFEGPVVHLTLASGFSPWTPLYWQLRAQFM